MKQALTLLIDAVQDGEGNWVIQAGPFQLLADLLTLARESDVTPVPLGMGYNQRHACMQMSLCLFVPPFGRLYEILMEMKTSKKEGENEKPQEPAPPT